MPERLTIYVYYITVFLYINIYITVYSHVLYREYTYVLEFATWR